MDVDARPAGPGDKDSLVALARDAVALQREKRGGVLWTRTSARSHPARRTDAGGRTDAPGWADAAGRADAPGYTDAAGRGDAATRIPALG